MQSVQSHVYSTLHAWLFIRVNLCEKFSLSRIRNGEVSCDVTHPCVVYATLRPWISQQIVRHLCNHFSVARLRLTLTEGQDTSNTSTPNQIVNHSVKSDQHTN